MKRVSANPESRLDPLSGRASGRPVPSAGEAGVRMVDVQMVWDAADTVSKQPRGARSRTAEKHGVSRATITEAVKRVEAALNVRLFAKAQSDKEEPLTAPGRAFVDHGKTFLESFQLLRKLVQDAKKLD